MARELAVEVGFDEDEPRGVAARKFVPTLTQRQAVCVILHECGGTLEQARHAVINPWTNAPLDPRVFRKHFAREIEEGQALLEQGIKLSLYRRAIDDEHPHATQAAIFLARSRFGMHDKIQVDVEANVRAGVVVVPATEAIDSWRQKYLESQQIELREPEPE
jgi:hypothetical protein